MHISRNILKEIFDYTYDPTLYSFLKFYHTKSSVIEFVPDQYGKITKILPHTNQLQTTKNLIPWLKEGLKVRFAEIPDGSTQALEQATINPDSYYYISNIINNNNCLRFNINHSLLPGDIVDLPYSNFDLTIIHDRSYIKIDDLSWLDIGMRVVFENNPTNLSAVQQSELAVETKYFIREILPGNYIRISSEQFFPNTVRDHYTTFIHFNNELVTNFDIYNDHTFIEGVSEDEVIILEAQINEKIVEFKKEFGMNQIDKPFHILDNFQEYPDDAAISVINEIDNSNEFVSKNINFTNPDGTFFDEFELNTIAEIPSLHPMRYNKGTLWNLGVNVTAQQQSRFNFMARTYPEYINFELFSEQSGRKNVVGVNENGIFSAPGVVVGNGTPIKFESPQDSSAALSNLGLLEDTVYYVKDVFQDGNFSISDTLNGDTLNIPYSNFNFFAIVVQPDETLPIADLLFEFGEPNYRFGQFVFEQGVTGTYIPLIIDNFKTSLDVIAEYAGTIYKQIPFRQYYIGPFLADENHIITIKDTSIFREGDIIRFSNPPDSADALDQAELDPYANYYVKEILNCTEFTISETLNGEVYPIKKAPFNFLLTVDTNIFQMIEFVPFVPIDEIERNLRKYIDTGLEIKFRNPEDSAGALEQAELLPETSYYVKDIKLRSEGVKNFTILKIDEENKLKIKKYEGHLYPDTEVIFTNRQDSTGAVEEAGLIVNKIYYIKEIFRKGWITISDTKGGPTKELPYSNFYFNIQMNMAKTEFTISETIDGEIFQVPYSNFSFGVYHKINQIHIYDTRFFRKNMPIKFEVYQDAGAIANAGLNSNTQYFIKDVIDKNRMTVTNEIDGQIIELTDVFEKFFIKHDTGNGYVFSSYIGELTTSTDIEFSEEIPNTDPIEYNTDIITIPTPINFNNDPTVYDRITLHSTDLSTIPNELPYQHIFNKLNIPYPTQPSLWGPFYENEQEYIWSTLPSPIWTPDYVVNITTQQEIITIPPDDPADLEDPEYVPLTYTVDTIGITGTDRNGPIGTVDELNNPQPSILPELTFIVGDKVQFNIDPALQNTNPIWIKTFLSKLGYYKAQGTIGNGTDTIQWTIVTRGIHYYQSATNFELNQIINVLPLAPTELLPLETDYKDPDLQRAFDTKRPLSKTDLNNRFVYIFELPQDTIQQIKSNPDLTGSGNEAKIYNIDRKSYLTPVAYLENRWIYPTHQVLRIFQLVGEKTFKVSDEGKMMITVKSPNGIFNYIFNGIQK